MPNRDRLGKRTAKSGLWLDEIVQPKVSVTHVLMVPRVPIRVASLLGQVSVRLATVLPLLPDTTPR